MKLSPGRISWKLKDLLTMYPMAQASNPDNPGSDSVVVPLAAYIRDSRL